jgi:hypothetical protein
MNQRRKTLSGLIAALLLASMLGFGGITQPDSVQAQTQGPRTVELLPTTTLTATGAGAAVRGFEDASILKYQVTCGSVSGDTPSFTFTLQDTLDGTVWNTLGTATAITANGSQTLLYAEVHASSAQLFTGTLRTAWTVSGTTPSASCRALVYAE